MEEIIKKLVEFREKRGWEKYHTAENLAKAICIESAELLECFQWSDYPRLADVLAEMADIGIYLLYMCEKCGVSLEEIIKAKMVKNAEKYPEDVRHEW